MSRLQGSALEKRDRVLVVEDDPSLRAVLCEAYAHRGFAVKVAGNAGAAREAIRQHQFDLILIDVTLPGGDDGFGLVRHATASSVGVILISGNPEMFDRVEGSGHAHLLKPFRLDELIGLSTEVIEKVHTTLRPSPGAESPRCAPHL